MCGWDPGVRRVTSLSTDYADEHETPEFQEFARLRGSFLQGLLAQKPEVLKAQIRVVDSKSDLNTVLDRYIAKNDLESSAAQLVAQVVTRRLAVLAPFSDFSGGDYLNPIYSGDSSEVKRQDRQYLATFESMLGRVNKEFAPGIQGFWALENPRR